MWHHERGTKGLFCVEGEATKILWEGGKKWDIELGGRKEAEGERGWEEEVVGGSRAE